MSLRMLERRTVWFPTKVGWLLIGMLFCAPLAAWWFYGETFLAVSAREPSRVLVVEGWIGAEGLHAAYREFVTGGYELIVATGGQTGEPWNQRRWNYAEVAEEQLLRFGVPRARLLTAPSRNVEVQRTFEMAAAARHALQRVGDLPFSINVVTRGAHARRSRLIFAKAFGPGTRVGVIPWKPPHFDEEPWWQTSDRSEDLVKETVGYLFERLLNSGRGSNHALSSE